MRHIVFYVGDYSVVSRLLEGNFLDYKSTIPEKSKNKIVINTQIFADSIERVSLLITDRLKSPVKCLFSENRVHLSCTTPIGKASDEISFEGEFKDELEIAFNNRYMTDALKNTDCDEIEIHLSGPLSPIKILPKEGSSFLFMVLPVRIKAE
jgi:DNA polymerase-3 subunit beta